MHSQAAVVTGAGCIAVTAAAAVAAVGWLKNMPSGRAQVWTGASHAWISCSRWGTGSTAGKTNTSSTTAAFWCACMSVPILVGNFTRVVSETCLRVTPPPPMPEVGLCLHVTPPPYVEGWGLSRAVGYVHRNITLST
jgi:hypothetical protein